MKVWTLVNMRVLGTDRLKIFVLDEAREEPRGAERSTRGARGVPSKRELSLLDEGGGGGGE